MGRGAKKIGCQKKIDPKGRGLIFLLMMGQFQWEFKHMVTKDTILDQGARISFTFRNILRHTPVYSTSQVRLS